ncbi:unnamed protein product, partial [Heterosigma akashiwo]
MLVIYVDGIQVASQSVVLQKKFVNQLGSVFKHKLSPASRFVGYDLERDRAAKTIKVTAASKIAHVLEAHNSLGEVHPKFTPCAPGVHLSSESSGKQVDVNTYQSLVGAFQFIREFRPDISFAVGKLSKFLVSPNLDHIWILLCTLVLVICGGLPPKVWCLAAPGTTPSGLSVTVIMATARTMEGLPLVWVCLLGGLSSSTSP